MASEEGSGLQPPKDGSGLQVLKPARSPPGEAAPCSVLSCPHPGRARVRISAQGYDGRARVRIRKL